MRRRGVAPMKTTKGSAIAVARSNVGQRACARSEANGARASALTYISGAILLAVGGLTACHRAAGPATANQGPAVPVQTAVAQQLDMPRVIESVGAVQALRTVAVKSQVDGMIAQIHF